MVPIDSQTKALIAAQAALDKQAEDVVILDLRDVSSIADFFVIGTAQSARQIKALQEHIEAALSKRGAPVDHLEGSAAGGAQEPHWVLMDCRDLVVHLFDPPARAFYRLEHLWADAARVPVSTPLRAGAA